MTDKLLAGRYEIGPLIGSGGSSRVYQARDTRLGRDVAVKILDLGLGDSRARERFLREALVGGRISHPNAVDVFDTGEDDGVLYITMELVAGEDLAKHLARVGSLPEHQAVNVVIQVLDVLHAAHRAGVVHRDVKPSNILLADDGRVRLVDFGIAKSLQDLTAGLTRTGEVIGTARYLSPEQVGGEPLGPATDLYSAGAVLFEALSGRPPFTDDTAVAVALAHRDQTPPPLATIAPGVLPAVASVVDQALAKDPASRPASAEAMAASLRERLGAPAETTTVLEQPPAFSAAPASGPTPRRTTMIAAVVGVLVGASFVAWLNHSDGGDQAAVRTEPTAEVASVTTTSTTAPPPTEPPTTTTVRSIGALTDLLSGSSEDYGEKGPDLLDKLQKVQRERGRDQAEKAADLIEEIDDWVEKGELQPAIAEQAREVLVPIAERGRGESGD